MSQAIQANNSKLIDLYGEEKNKLRKKENKLRDEKNKLLDKENKLIDLSLEKQKQLRDEKKQVLHVSSAGDYSAFEGVVSFPLAEISNDLADARLSLSRRNTEWFKALGDLTSDQVKLDDATGLAILQTPLLQDLKTTPSAAKDIYVRSFYERLFNVLLSLRRVALVGNPGLGKSWFQHYCLLRALHPTFVGSGTAAKPLWKPPSNDWVPPECVLRQIGSERFEVYLVKHRSVWIATPRSGLNFVELFDQNKILYLFEPGSDKDKEPLLLLDPISIATVSPNARRIKEFSKMAAMRYMPVWTLPELHVVGAHLRGVFAGDTDMQVLYSVAEIEARFEMFGGILRYVLPVDRDTLQTYFMKRQTGIENVNFHILSKAGLNIDGAQTNISHHAMHYDVDRTGNFGEFKLVFSSEHTKIDLEKKASNLAFMDLLNILWECIQGQFPERMRVVLEPVTWEMLLRGEHWETWSPPGVQHLAQPPAIREFQYTREIPRNMKDETLYIASSPNFPLVEAVMKHGNTVIGFQCKTGSFTRFEPSTCLSMRKKLGISNDVPLHIYIVTTPLNTDDWIQKMSRTPKPWAQRGSRGGSSGSPDQQPTEDVEAVERVTFSIIHHTFNPLRVDPNKYARKA